MRVLWHKELADERVRWGLEALGNYRGAVVEEVEGVASIDELMEVHDRQLVLRERRRGSINYMLANLYLVKRALELNDRVVVLLGGRSIGAGRTFLRLGSLFNVPYYISRIYEEVVVVSFDKHFPHGHLSYLELPRALSLIAIYSGGEGVGQRLMRREKYEGRLFLIPVPPGATDRVSELVLRAIRRLVESLRPRALVISLGADMHFNDLGGEHFLTSSTYYELGRVLGAVAGPERVFVNLECGSSKISVGHCIVSFTAGALGDKRPFVEQVKLASVDRSIEDKVKRSIAYVRATLRKLEGRTSSQR